MQIDLSRPPLLYHHSLSYCGSDSIHRDFGSKNTSCELADFVSGSSALPITRSRFRVGFCRAAQSKEYEILKRREGLVCLICDALNDQHDRGDSRIVPAGK
jgi:hypothetical protein